MRKLPWATDAAIYEKEGFICRGTISSSEKLEPEKAGVPFEGTAELAVIYGRVVQGTWLDTKSIGLLVRPKMSRLCRLTPQEIRS